MQVMEKRKGRKSSTKRSRLTKGSDKITDTLRANSSTADIRGSDIAVASLGIAMPQHLPQRDRVLDRSGH
jgi:hypothetical protein